MDIRRTRNGLIHGSIAAAAIVALGFAAPSANSGPSEGVVTMTINGVVRDFRNTNSDFTMSPAGGNGHYAGNVDLVLGGDNIPVFTGGGFKVADQWLDMDGDPIAPHMYDEGGNTTIDVVSAPTVIDAAVVDTWSASAGAYGGANVGDAPAWNVGASMPAVSAPSPLPAKVDKVEYKGLGTSTLSTNRYCKDFVLQNERTLRISGNIWIYATDSFTIENESQLVLLSGASLTIYIGKDGKIQNDTLVNMTTWDPTRLTIVNLGSNPFILENGGELCATIISPNASLTMKNEHQFYGHFTGKSVSLQNSAGFHIEGSAGTSVCGSVLADSEGAAGTASSGGIASADHFAQWYTDTLGANLSTNHAITLTQDSSGVFEYLDDGFFPIDNQLFGNEEEEHNYYYTYSFTVEFVHRACDDRFFEFYGCDDAWLFVDGDLALDLGGVIPDTTQTIELDRMGLVDGETYRLHFFYAQRNSDFAIFRLRTNLDLVDESLSSAATGTFD